MNANRRPRRVFWFLGLALLLASAAGVRLLLPASHAEDISSAGKDPSAIPEIIALGYVDVESGVTPLYPAQPGRVVEVRAQANRTYDAGAVLLRVDDELVRTRLDEAQAALRIAQEELAQAEKLPKQERDEKVKQQKLAIKAAEYHLTSAQRDLEYRQLQAEHHNINAKLVDAAREQVERLRVGVQAEKARLDELNQLDVTAKARLARLAVEAKKLQVREAELALKQFQVTAPAAGEVLRVLVNEGEVLGTQPKQPALWFAPAAKDRIIRAEIEQEYAGRVHEGMAAVIEDDTRAGGRWTGRVARLSDWYTHRRSILQEPFQVNDVRTLEAVVTLDPGQPRLRVGQRMRVILGRNR
jgi:membrane fusion protein (multidrug efflux system)